MTEEDDDRRHPPSGRARKEKVFDRWLLGLLTAGVLSACGILWNVSLGVVELQADFRNMKELMGDRFTGRQGADLKRRVRNVEVEIRDHMKVHK